MTEAAVSAKRSELAAWLREGLVKLGPTFIKARLSLAVLRTSPLGCRAPAPPPRVSPA